MGLDKPTLLIIEDNPGDARLVLEMLKVTGDGRYAPEWADRLSTGLKFLSEQKADLVLLDLGLPDSQGLETLDQVYALSPRTPIVIMTGLDDESVGIQAVSRGAQDYLVKGKIDGKVLLRVIKYTLERQKIEQALQASEENFRNSIDNSPLGIRIIREDGLTLYTNRALLDMLGYQDINELNSIPIQERFTAQSYAEHLSRKEKRYTGQSVPDTYELNVIRKDGTLRLLKVFRKEVLWNGKVQYQALYQDITQSREAEAQILLNESRLESLLRISQFEAENVQDLLDFALQEAIQLTKSKIGYLYNYSDQKEFILTNWSSKETQDCELPTLISPYKVESTGALEEVVLRRKPLILNDCRTDNPVLPPGYPELTRLKIGRAHV
jgi:PAS domain S-box-containing protein